MVSSAVSASNCLGVSGVDIGHNRVPDPPERMTGMIDVVSGIHGSFAVDANLGSSDDLPNSQKVAGFRGVQPFFVNFCDTA
jgi:hypothetical protein